MEEEKNVSKPEMDAYDREEQCRKTIRTVGRAAFMRLLVTALLLFILVGAGLQGWVIGLMVFVLIISRVASSRMGRRVSTTASPTAGLNLP